MSRKFALLAAVVAFCGLTSVAFAQGGQGGQGSGGTDTSANLTAPSAGAGGSMRARPMRARPMAQRTMRQGSGRMAMRGTGRAGMAAQPGNPNAAYMGGGAVYERAADGSLRAVN